MLDFALYLLATLIALAWIAVDDNAVAAFEVFKRRLHSTARDMGIYREWLAPQLMRATLLTSCVSIGVVAATSMRFHNPWDLGWLGRTSLFGIMLGFSITLLAMPHLSTHLRLKQFLNCKATELSQLVPEVSTVDGIRQYLEPAELDTFDGEDGWTAWHPCRETWDKDPFWEGLTPVVYLYQYPAASLIVPVDFEHFLAWRLPAGSVTPGECMPIWPRFSVRTVSCLPGCEGWSIIRANMEPDDAAA